MQFDECHKAKNLMNEQGNPTLTGVAVRHIQDKLPSAAVLYSSATGISEPNNMAYMVRLGNFGHNNMNDLIKSLIDSGLGASELFSCSLKSEGIYVARYVSIHATCLACLWYFDYMYGFLCHPKPHTQIGVQQLDLLITVLQKCLFHI